jgi:phosphate starvation-inducible PhoH-like protein
MQQKRKTKKEVAEEEKKVTLQLYKADFNPIKFTHAQLNFFKTIKENFMTVCTGPAGTAKTFVACYAALDLLKDGEHKKIILARPAVESGENLGFLPGTMEEKIAPYMKGYISNMGKIVDGDKLKALMTANLITMEPLAFMRSETFDDTILILDEAQNADLRQLMLVITRMGKNSRIIICGDVTQWDIKNRRKDLLVLNERIINGVKGCSAFQFSREDIVRNPILIQLTDNYEAYKEENGIDK